MFVVSLIIQIYRGFRQAAAKLPWSVICSLYVRFHKEGPTIDFLPKPKHNGTTKYNDEV